MDKFNNTNLLTVEAVIGEQLFLLTGGSNGTENHQMQSRQIKMKK